MGGDGEMGWEREVRGRLRDWWFYDEGSWGRDGDMM